MDDGIDLLINELKQIGLKENTLIIFASDNGSALVGSTFD